MVNIQNFPKYFFKYSRVLIAKYINYYKNCITFYEFQLRFDRIPERMKSRKNLIAGKISFLEITEE